MKFEINKSFTFKVASNGENKSKVKAQEGKAIASGCSKVSAPFPINVDFRSDRAGTPQRDDGFWC